MDLKDGYFLVDWPESQNLMGKKGFNQCILGDIGSSMYFVPIHLFHKLLGYNPSGTVYFLYRWPESQEWIGRKGFKQCIATLDIKNHVKTGSSAYFVPWNLILAKQEYVLINQSEFMKYPNHVWVMINGFGKYDYAVPVENYKSVTGKKPRRIYRVVMDNNPNINKEQYIRIPNISLYDFPQQPYLVKRTLLRKKRNKNGNLQ